MNEAKLPSLAAVCEVMIDAMRRAEQTPKEESKMTDHKLPPLPASARTTRDPMSNEFVRYWTAEQMHAHWLDGYRAGQSSAEPMTREKAAELALDHCTRPDLSTRFEVIKGGKFATWLIEAIIEASLHAPSVPKEWLRWLRDMEWHGWQYKRDGDGAPTCPDCGAFQEDGHKESCELAKLLAAAQMQSTGDQGFADGVRSAIAVIESHKIPVGNSATGEMACKWTYEALKEIREKLRELAPTPPI